MIPIKVYQFKILDLIELFTNDSPCGNDFKIVLLQGIIVNYF